MTDIQKTNIKNLLITKLAGFKDWVEQTSLFAALSNDFGETIRCHDIDGNISMEFERNGIPINVAEDLPIELLIEFFINSPFFNETNQKLLT